VALTPQKTTEIFNSTRCRPVDACYCPT